MTKLPNMTYAAPHGKRIMAFLIDSTISMILAKLASAVLGTASPTLGAILAIFTPAIYFIVFPLKMNATPGKKMLGLELVRSETGETLTLGAMIGRETIGRLLSGMFFMAGYIAIFLNENHSAFHDKIFKTQVVSVVSPEETNYLKLVLTGFGTVATVVGIGLYTILFTSLPLERVVATLETEGIHVNGIKGNLMKGFSFESLVYNNETAEVRVEDVAFEYKNYFPFFRTEGTIIEKIVAGRVDINIKKAESLVPSIGAAKKQPPTPAPQEASAQNEPQKAKLKITVQNIDINNFNLQKEGKNLINFNRFYASQMFIENKNLSLEKIWLESKSITANLEYISFNENDFGIKKSDIILKKELFPDVLAGDLDFHLSGQGEIKTKNLNLDIEGLRKSVSISYKDQKFHLAAANFQPHWYFKNNLPLHTVNLEFSGNLLDLLLAPQFKGSFVMRNRQFQLLSPQKPGRLLEASAQENGQTWTTHFVLNKQKNEQPLLINLQSSAYTEQHTALNMFYFGKSDGLSDAESQVIASDAKFFQTTFPELRIPASAPAETHQ